MKAKCIGCIGCSRRDVNSLLDLPRVYICRVGDCPPLLRLHYGRHTPARKLKISETRSSTLKYNPDLDDVIPKGRHQSALDVLIISSSLAGIWACFYLTCRIDMN